MICGKARKILYLADRLEAVSPQRLEADAHLHGCPECQRFFSEEETFKSLLKARAPKPPVPPHLREKILEQISEAYALHAHPNRPAIVNPHRIRAVVAAAALVAAFALLAGIIGYTVYSGKMQEQFVAGLVDDHVRFRPGASEISSSRFEEVEAWFNGKVDFAVQAPRFEQSELLGGRLCYLDGMKGAWLVYRKHGALLSFFIFDRMDITVDRFQRRDLGERRLGLGAGKGHRYILWKDQGLAYALISDLPEDELLRLASGVTSPRRI